MVASRQQCVHCGGVGLEPDPLTGATPQPSVPARTAFVWLKCRTCGKAAEVTQGRLDDLERTRPGTSDLCAVCHAKYGEYEDGAA